MRRWSRSTLNTPTNTPTPTRTPTPTSVPPTPTPTKTPAPTATPSSGSINSVDRLIATRRDHCGASRDHSACSDSVVDVGTARHRRTRKLSSRLGSALAWWLVVFRRDTSVISVTDQCSIQRATDRPVELPAQHQDVGEALRRPAPMERVQQSRHSRRLHRHRPDAGSRRQLLVPDASRPRSAHGGWPLAFDLRGQRHRCGCRGTAAGNACGHYRCNGGRGCWRRLPRPRW